ncbi:MAG: hypothetical protein FJ271_16470 [Planctomycetes bacterium]|nr:hypothetical protein [Planctomycetota bacterium]
MAPDDPTDGQFRQGEPPFRARTEKPGRFAPQHLAMVILVWSLRVVAVLIAGWAGLGAFFAMMFRFDSSDELEWVKQVDVEVGGAMALAVVLFFVPNRIKKPLQCVLILGVAILLWVFVSWNLIAHHNWLDRVRSGL